MTFPANIAPHKAIHNSKIRVHYSGRVQFIPVVGNIKPAKEEDEKVLKIESITQEVAYILAKTPFSNVEVRRQLTPTDFLCEFNQGQNYHIDEFVSDHNTINNNENSTMSQYDRKNRKEEGFKFSTSAKNKVRNICHYLYRNKPKKSKFLWYTFTVPSIEGREYNPKEDDQIVMKCFSKLLQSLRKNWGLKSYLWVAERQDGKRNNYEFKTNAIHFHCIFIQSDDTFLDGQAVNFYWTRLLYLCPIPFNVFCDLSDFVSDQGVNKTLFARMCNYIKSGQNVFPTRILGENWKSHFIFQRFKTTDGNYKRVYRNPVDFKKVTSLRSLAIYLSKYLSKGDERFYCRTNGATRDLSSLKLTFDLPDSDSIKKVLKSKYAFSVHESEVVIDPDQKEIVDSQTGEVYETPPKVLTFTTIVTNDKFFDSFLYTYIQRKLREHNEKSKELTPTNKGKPT